MTAWLAAGGEEKVIDYLCPQVYWGYGFTLHSGSTRFAFENIVPAWLAYPRAGMWRCISGWAHTGWAGGRRREPGQRIRLEHRQCTGGAGKDLRQQAAGGWALYRYGSLFRAGGSRTGRGRVRSAAGAEYVKIVQKQAANRTK